MTHKTIGTASYETNILVDRLRKAVKDDDYGVISYEELGKLIDRNLPKDSIAASYLRSARRIVEREEHRMFGVVAGEGVKMLTADEQARTAPALRQKIRGATRRGLKRLALVDFSNLSAKDQREHTVTASILGAITMFTKTKSVERIRGAATNAERPLAIGETLKLFANNGNGDQTSRDAT